MATRKSLAYGMPRSRRPGGRDVPSAPMQRPAPVHNAVRNTNPNPAIGNGSVNTGYGAVRDPRPWWQGGGFGALAQAQMPNSVFSQLFGQNGNGGLLAGLFGGGAQRPPQQFRPINAYPHYNTFNPSTAGGPLYDTNYGRYGR